MNKLVLIIDIKAKFASFRKIDSNSSSLTYRFPPRTTIIGIMAAILGLEKDSYYAMFQDSKIAVKILEPSRTIFQSVNNINIKSSSDLNFLKRGIKGSPTIIPTELLVPVNFNTSLGFRVYFSDENIDLFQGIWEKLVRSETVYPTSLGYANMLSHVKLVCKSELMKIDEENKHIEIVTPIPSDKVESLDIETGKKDRKLRILKDLVPTSVIRGRYFRNKSYIFEETGKPILVKLKSLNEIYSTSYDQNGIKQSENICFL